MTLRATRALAQAQAAQARAFDAAMVASNDLDELERNPLLCASSASFERYNIDSARSRLDDAMRALHATDCALNDLTLTIG